MIEMQNEMKRRLSHMISLLIILRDQEEKKSIGRSVIEKEITMLNIEQTRNFDTWFSRGKML